MYIIQYVLYILPRKIGFNSKAINVVHCNCTLCKVALCVTKMHQTLKQKYEGSIVIHKRRPQEWGEAVLYQGGQWGRAVLGVGGKISVIFRL